MSAPPLAFPTKLSELLDDEARRRHTSVSAIVRQLITEGLVGSAERPREIPWVGFSTIQRPRLHVISRISWSGNGRMRSVAIVDSGPLLAAAMRSDPAHDASVAALQTPGLRLVIPA